LAKSIDPDRRQEDLKVLKRQLRSREERGFFRRLLLIELQKSAKRDLLLRCYEQLGFLKEDLTQLTSFRWWKRLEAVLRLEQVQHTQTLSYLRPLIDDRDDLVALGAMRALAAIDDTSHIIQILAALSRRAPSRRDLFLEILTLVGKQDSEALLQFVNECFDPYLASLAIFILGELKIRQSIPLLQHLIKSSDDEVVRTSAEALGKMGEARTLESLLGHESPSIRATALRYWGQESAGLETERLLSRFSKDSSQEVKRVLFDLKRNGISAVKVP
jgi:HEAT repeat protein